MELRMCKPHKCIRQKYQRNIIFAQRVGIHCRRWLGSGLIKIRSPCRNGQFGYQRDWYPKKIVAFISTLCFQQRNSNSLPYWHKKHSRQWKSIKWRPRHLQRLEQSLQTVNRMVQRPRTNPWSRLIWAALHRCMVADRMFLGRSTGRWESISKTRWTKATSCSNTNKKLLRRRAA